MKTSLLGGMMCLLAMSLGIFALDVDVCCTYTMTGSTFPCCDQGNCTWWAAYKCREMNTVCASKNARDWYVTAQNALVEVGSLPARCGVVCFSGGDHVAYVETVKPTSIIVSEMLCNTTLNCYRQREITLPSSAITGYIYPATNGVTSWDFKDRTLGWRIRANCTHADFFPAPPAGDWWRLNPTGVQPQIYSPYSQTPIPSNFKYFEVRYSVKGSGESVPCRAYYDTGSGAWENYSVKSIIRNNAAQTVTFDIPAPAIGKTLRVLLDLFDVSQQGGVYQGDQISINNASFKEVPTHATDFIAWRNHSPKGHQGAVYDIRGKRTYLSARSAELVLLDGRRIVVMTHM